MRRTVIVVLDGLRRDFIDEARTPNLCAFANRAESFSQHRSVFVSTTRVAAASLATGCLPARHELQGNEMALFESGLLVAHDAGHPDFLQHKRRVTGRSLAVPTMAERVKEIGGAVIFSNVSPGAAYALDPDGHGFVFHRAGSFGPGRVPVPAARHLAITPDGAGDNAMTTRFIAEALEERQTALSILWLGDPDKTQHSSPLGSPKHLAALRGADANAGRVAQAVDRLRDTGSDVLLMICSDHGHQTVTDVIDIDGELVAAGLKSGIGSGDVMVAANGTAALIYLHPDHRKRAAALHDYLMSRPWADRVVAAQDLAAVGQAPLHGLSFAIALLTDDEKNAHGVPGTGIVAKPSFGKDDHMGFGQHGGLGTYEQAPFLIVNGAGFQSGGARDTATSVVDLAPTALSHLGLACGGMDGTPLQDAPARAGVAPRAITAS